MDRHGDTYPAGGGLDGPFEKISLNERPSTQRLKVVAGHTYSIGLFRKVFRRVGVDRWEKLDAIPGPVGERAIDASGFSDLDAFSPSDMYAVGGQGDVWHFNGTSWRRMGFPSNEQLATVTCAGDGNVYITSEGGTLWVGLQSTWHLVERMGSSVLCNDAVWFNGQLWMASDYALRIWNGKQIVAPEFDGLPVVTSGHMDAHDGLLAIASLWRVSTFDGQAWREIVAPYDD